MLKWVRIYNVRQNLLVSTRLLLTNYHCNPPKHAAHLNCSTSFPLLAYTLVAVSKRVAIAKRLSSPCFFVFVVVYQTCRHCQTLVCTMFLCVCSASCICTCKLSEAPPAAYSRLASSQSLTVTHIASTSLDAPLLLVAGRHCCWHLCWGYGCASGHVLRQVGWVAQCVWPVWGFCTSAHLCCSG